MKSVSVTVRGKRSEWVVDCVMRQGQIDAMREDGVSVDEIMYRVPAWAVSIGLTKPWCFAQDVYNFRNPFAS